MSVGSGGNNSTNRTIFHRDANAKTHPFRIYTFALQLGIPRAPIALVGHPTALLRQTWKQLRQRLGRT
jgi:hypothetical protein